MNAREFVEYAKMAIVAHLEQMIREIAKANDSIDDWGEHYVYDEQWQGMATHLDLEVWDAYTDEYYHEQKLLTELCWDGNNVMVYCEDTENNAKDLSMENLVRVATILEKVVKRMEEKPATK